MKHPSKRSAALARAEAKRQEAIASNDASKFAQALEELAEAESQDDIYTCIACGGEFGEEDHIDLLVAAVLVHRVVNGVMTVVDERDYGILATEKRESGRRIKLCGGCAGDWQIPILEYLELR